MKFDIIIRNGLIIDGTGAKGRVADIGIAGGVIAAFGKLGAADVPEVIEAKGKIVSPGFIDIHGHSDYFILIEPDAPNKLRQGVTTEIGGNCGYSAAPVSKKLSDERGDSLDKNFGLRPDWLSLDEYYERLEKIKPAINFGILVGHNTIRASVMGGSAASPSKKEMDAMKRMVKEGMAQGALGISTGLIYPPGCFADKDELTTLCKAARGGFFATHMRSEGNELIESIEEVIAVARAAKIPLQISHLKTSGQRNWGKMDEAIELIENARKEGVEVNCDRYPYTASFTGLSAVLPNWVFEGTREEYRKRLLVPEVRKRIRQELDTEHPEGDYLNKVVIAQTFSKDSHKFEGLSVADAAKRQKKEALEFLLDFLAAEESDQTAIYHTMSEENMLKVLAWQHSVVGSDSAIRSPGPPLGTGKIHPRAYGCFARFMELVREKKFISIEEAIKKMTGQTAKLVGLDRRGFIKRGYAADIVVFDPDKIADNATYDSPHKFATGFDCVIVNGKIAVRNDEITGVRNGAVLRRR